MRYPKNLAEMRAIADERKRKSDLLQKRSEMRKALTDSMIEEKNIDSDGAWIYLRHGYQWAGTHIIHEDTMPKAMKRLSEVEICTCGDCQGVGSNPNV